MLILRNSIIVFVVVARDAHSVSCNYKFRLRAQPGAPCEGHLSPTSQQASMLMVKLGVMT